MQDDPLSPDNRLYNSRIVDSYIKLLKNRYPHVAIEEVLEYAGMQAYEVHDQGHWFTQDQIDRLHAILQQKTGHANIAREAGRFAASPEAMGVLRQLRSAARTSKRASWTPSKGITASISFRNGSRWIGCEKCHDRTGQ